VGKREVKVNGCRTYGVRLGFDINLNADRESADLQENADEMD
jgi:hypothetical protein